MKVGDIYKRYHLLFFALLIVMAFLFFYKVKVQNEIVKNEKLVHDVEEKEKLVKLYGEKVKMEGEFERLMSLFPSSLDFKWLMEELNKLIKEEKIELVAVQPQPIVSEKFYRQLMLSLKIEGSYYQIGRLLERIDNSEKYIEVVEFEITPKYILEEKGKKRRKVKARDGNVLLSCELRIKTIVPRL